MNTLYQLASQNLTRLGGPMGTEYVTNNYTKFFTTVDKAKAYAEKEYGKPLTWHKTKGKDRYRTDDLRYVMYYITPVRTEA